MRQILLLALLCGLARPAAAADYPQPVAADWTAPDFRFHTGAVLPLRLHYTTVGDPHGMPVLILHGTAGSGDGMLTPAFAGSLFGPGQALDAAKYYLILPDAIGTGGSAKPSDGLGAGFPAYDYDDMVAAAYRLLTEGLGVRHLRLVLGNSMGGMETWLWGERYPGFMDALVPMASQPTAMAGRNWMLRRLLVEEVRRDPASLRYASAMFGVATAGGTLAYQAAAPTTAKADALVEARLAAPPPPDAGDFVAQWDASRDYDPAPELGRIVAAVLAINSADDERNPPETGLMTQALTHVHDARLLLIPASAQTRGHLTTAIASFWSEALRGFLAEVPERP